MSLVTINIGSRQFQLSCKENEIEHLKNLASVIDKKFKQISTGNTGANFELSLVILLLMQEDERHELTSSTMNENNQKALADLEKSQESTLNEIHDRLRKLRHKYS